MIFEQTGGNKNFGLIRSAVRETLVSRGIRPENLSPEEDVKKVERKLISDEKKIVKKSGFSKK